MELKIELRAIGDCDFTGDRFSGCSQGTKGGLGAGAVSRGGLVRQISGTRVEASYSDDDLREGLQAATASVFLLVGYLLAKFTGRNDAAGEIEILFEQAS